MLSCVQFFATPCVCLSFSCFQLFATPWTVACQVPMSMEFSRQEYWSGFPVPSPEKLPHPEIQTMLLLCLVTQSCPTLCNPMDCSPPGFSVHGILQARKLFVGCHFLLQGIFVTQGSNQSLLHWQVGSVLLSHQGKLTCLFTLSLKPGLL